MTLKNYHPKNLFPRAGFLLLFFLFVGGSVVLGKGQSIDDEITINLQNNTLEEAFRVIEQNSSYIFLYQSNLVSEKRKLTLKLESTKIDNVLDELFKGTQIGYQIIDRQIILSQKKQMPKESNEKTSQPSRSSSTSKTISQMTVSGNVTDASDNEPLIGVTVIIKGTTQGVITDVNGSYEIRVPGPEAILVFSYVGYRTQEIPVNGRTTVNVSLEQETTELEEIVVVGFGKQSRITTTGSISSVSVEDIDKISTPTIAEGIFGKTPGLQMVQTSGTPGGSDPQIFLRGIGTFNSADPLVIIDGIPNSIRDFMQLNPSNVANISILKDASATAVYGVRGANGVIIVETRQGQSGKTQIDASVNYGYQMPTKLLEFANSYQWATAYNQTLLNDGRDSELIPEKHIQHYKNQDQPLLFPDNDWVDEVVGNMALQTRSNINISGGTEKVTYHTSLGYFHQGGLLTQVGDDMKNYNYNRFNIGSNINMNITPTTNVTFNTRIRTGIRNEPHGVHPERRWNRIYETSPMASVGFVDGRLISIPEFYNPYSNKGSIYQDLYGGAYNRISENRLNFNLDIRQELKVLSPALDGLELRIKGGYQSGFTERTEARVSDYESYEAIYNADIVSPDPSLSDSAIVLRQVGDPEITRWFYNYGANRYVYWEAGLEYQKQIGQHYLGALFLYNQNKDFYPNLAYSNIATGNLGLVGRINYNYNKQYMLEFNLGYNGSENFAPGKRYGLFPSVSGAWVISEESFLESLEFISFFKIRASYGIVGSDQAGNAARFIYLGDTYLRDGNKYFGYNFGNSIPDFQTGALEAAIGNPNVTWETARKQNYGVDLAFFRDRLSLNFDYFYEYRNDILMFRNSDPEWLAMDLPPLNIGEVENQGFEAQVGWKSEIGDFRYEIAANISRAENKILYMDEIPPLEPYQSMTGQPLGSRFGYIWEGFYSEEEAATIAIERENMVDPEDRTYPIPDIVSSISPGDMKYKDVNGDGRVNEADQMIFGYPDQPQVIGGININMSWRGFDLSLGIQGATEVSRNLKAPILNNFGATNDRSLFLPIYETSWTPERAANGTAEWPRLTFANKTYNSLPSTWVNRDASYIRLRRVEIGYSLSSNLLRRIGIRNFRIYVMGNNIFTLQKEEFRWIDPERRPGASDISYPLMKFFATGINITF